MEHLTLPLIGLFSALSNFTLVVFAVFGFTDWLKNRGVKDFKTSMITALKKGLKFILRLYLFCLVAYALFYVALHIGMTIPNGYLVAYCIVIGMLAASYTRYCEVFALLLVCSTTILLTAILIYFRY